MIVWGKSLLMAPLKGRDISKLSAREIAAGQMQPSTIAVKHRILWAAFSERDICFQQKHFNFKGSYKWYWKHRFSKIKEIRPDFGRETRKQMYDHYEEEKIWAAYYDLDKNFRPYTCISDLLMLLVWKVLKFFCYCGAREPASLLNEDIIIKVETGGQWKGLKKMKLIGFSVEKSVNLTLSNPVERSGDFTSIVEDRYNKLCIVQLVEHYRETHLPTNYTGKFFCKEATLLQLGERKKKEPRNKSKVDYRNGHFKPNDFDRYVRKLAVKCDFEYAKK